MTGKKAYAKPLLENCGSISERTLELDERRRRRRLPRYPSGGCPCCNLNGLDQGCK